MKCKQQELDDNRHQATLSHNFRFNSEKYRKRDSSPCLCNIKLDQNKSSLGLLEKRFPGYIIPMDYHALA